MNEWIRAWTCVLLSCMTREKVHELEREWFIFLLSEFVRDLVCMHDVSKMYGFLLIIMMTLLLHTHLSHSLLTRSYFFSSLDIESTQTTLHHHQTEEGIFSLVLSIILFSGLIRLLYYVCHSHSSIKIFHVGSCHTHLPFLYWLPFLHHRQG